MSPLEQVQRRLQSKWQLCQWGVRECLESTSSLDYVLAWLRSQGDPLTHEWEEILQGQRPELRETLLSSERFPGTGRWRQRVSSSPFPLLRRHLADQQPA